MMAEGDIQDTMNDPMESSYKNKAKNTVSLPTAHNDQEYNMGTILEEGTHGTPGMSKRGKAVIFNQLNFDYVDEVEGDLTRWGSEKDIETLKTAFTYLGFEDIEVFQDLTVVQIEDELAKVSKMDHTDHDCLLVVISTHGELGKLYAKDRTFNVEKLWEPFTGNKCKTLVGKPKIFLIQACLGEKENREVKVTAMNELDKVKPHVKVNPRDEVALDQGKHRIPVYADFLVYHATVPGFVSYRSTSSGTWCLQSLCSLLKEKGLETDFVSLLTLVNYRLANYHVTITDKENRTQRVKQIGCIESMLTKKLYFRSIKASYTTKIADHEVYDKPPSHNNEKYSMGQTKRGLAVIFIHSKYASHLELEERVGSDLEKAILSEAFSHLGFDVRIQLDLTVSEIEEELAKVAAMDHTDNDCLVVAISTHGNENGEVFAIDGNFSVKNLWKPFSGRKCITLAGKPKIFFIQGCRGNVADPGVVVDTRQRQKKAPTVQSYIPSYADALIFYSTIPGYVSIRNPKKGSWFVESLGRLIKEKGRELDLLCLLTLVNQDIALNYIGHRHDGFKKQMPCIMSMLTRKLYFRPKP